MRALPITEAREALTSLPDKLNATHETITVTRRGKPVLAILPWEEYEALTETLDIMADKSLMAELRQSLKEAKQGKLIPWERVKRKLELWPTRLLPPRPPSTGSRRSRTGGSASKFGTASMAWRMIPKSRASRCGGNLRASEACEPPASATGSSTGWNGTGCW